MFDSIQGEEKCQIKLYSKKQLHSRSFFPLVILKFSSNFHNIRLSCVLCGGEEQAHAQNVPFFQF